MRPALLSRFSMPISISRHRAMGMARAQFLMRVHYERDSVIRFDIFVDRCAMRNMGFGPGPIRRRLQKPVRAVKTNDERPLCARREPRISTASGGTICFFSGYGQRTTLSNPPVPVLRAAPSSRPAQSWLHGSAALSAAFAGAASLFRWATPFSNAHMVSRIAGTAALATRLTARFI